MGSVAVVHGAVASWHMDPRPGMEPTSCALAGRFLSIAPPGKSLQHKIFNCDEALFILFFFLPFVILVLYLKRLCLTQGHERLCQYFLLTAL